MGTCKGSLGHNRFAGNDKVVSDKPGVGQRLPEGDGDSERVLRPPEHEAAWENRLDVGRLDRSTALGVLSIERLIVPPRCLDRIRQCRPPLVRGP